MNKIEVTLTYNLSYAGCGKKAFKPRIWNKKIKIIESCKKFKDAVKQGYIGFDNESYHTCYFPLAIMKSVSYPGDYDEAFMGIEFCPFCGDKLNIEVKEIFENISKSLLKHSNRKTKFLKGYNEIFLRIRLHNLNNKKEAGSFTYKFGLDKILYEVSK